MAAADKTEFLHIRITTKQLRDYKARAKVVKRSLSDWIRLVLDRNTKGPPDKDEENYI